MKSIEAFSVEYAQDKYLPVQTSQAVKAGADYSIAMAIEWLKDFCNEHYIMSYADSSEVDTKELIEIFKKKMEE